MKSYVYGGLLGMILMIPLTANAAVLSLVPERTVVPQKETVRIGVVLDTEGEEINAVEMSIPIPPAFEVRSIETGNSVVTLWAEAPRYDEKKREVHFAGGIPGGFVGQATLITMVAQVNEGGDLMIADGAQVLLNDGKGTSAKIISREGTRLVVKSPEAVEITSSTNPDQAMWYSKRTVEFSWKKKPGAAYSVLLDEGPQTVPDVIIDNVITPLKIQNVPDGIHYFHVHEKANGVWSEPAHFRVQIDGTPPEAFTAAFEGDNITWNTVDKASGIDHYTIGFAPKPFSAIVGIGVKTQSPHQVSGVARFFGGTYVITAFDKAGNATKTRLELAGGKGGFVLIILLGVAMVAALATIFERRRKKLIR